MSTDVFMGSYAVKFPAANHQTAEFPIGGHLRSVTTQDELDVMADEAQRDSGVSVARLMIPLPLALTLALGFLGTIGTLGWTAYSTIDHAQDKIKHLDETAVVKGAGPAFVNDVKAVQADADRKYQNLRVEMQRLFRESEMRCRPLRNGAISCTWVPPLMGE